MGLVGMRNGAVMFYHVRFFTFTHSIGSAFRFMLLDYSPYQSVYLQPQDNRINSGELKDYGYLRFAMSSGDYVGLIHMLLSGFRSYFLKRSKTRLQWKALVSGACLAEL
jgi:hypothetical protein